MRLAKLLTATALGAVVATAAAGPAAAGSENGNFMVRLQAADVISQDKVKSLTLDPGGVDLRNAGFDASVSDTWIPALTLTYFLNQNLSLELLCCFSKHSVKLEPPAANAALAGDVADFWIFPPAVTLQYHFTGLGAFKPYVGVGAQYVHFFNEKTSDNTLNASKVSFKDAFGPTLQAGIDISLGGGWYMNADVKKSWLDTTVTWADPLGAGNTITGKVDVDPLIVSVGVGYRFNLSDVFGGRSYAPMK